MCASWNPNAITFADNNTLGSQPISVFVDRNNTVYATAFTLNRVLVWSDGSPLPTRNLSGSLNNSYSIFASSVGDVYVDNGVYNKRVDRWTLDAVNSTIAMYVNGICSGLFIDVYNYLYCSRNGDHQVIKKSLNSDTNTSTVVAGNGTAGNASDMLNKPVGIFITIRLDLYVADCGNNRIQLFSSGRLNGTTVVGSGASGTTSLNCPTGVIFDADEHLFISDYNNRIIRSISSGFECLFGCTGGGGSTAIQLNNPRSLSFDSHGNLFVADRNNSRIQKFLLTTNSCGEYFSLFSHQFISI